MINDASPWQRVLAACSLLWALFLPAGLLAQTFSPIALETLVHLAAKEPVPAKMRMIQGLSAQIGIDQVSQLPDSQFEPFIPTRSYQFSHQQPTWLHLRLSADQPSNGAVTLEFPTVLIDIYEVFQKDASGMWRKSLAGDSVAMTDWPARTLRPRFPMLLPRAGVHDVYVRVSFRLKADMQPVFVTPELGQEGDSSSLLVTSLIVGACLAIAFTCLHMSISFRDWTYFWYASYLLMTVMAAITYSGLGQQLIWTRSAYFSNHAIALFMVCLMASNALFSRAMFGNLQRRWYHWWAASIAVSSLIYCALRLAFDDYSRISFLYNAIVVVTFVFVLYSATSAWLKGVVFGAYWLAVYVPFLTLAGSVVAKSTGMLTLSWLPDELPMFALLLEALAMMVCLNLYSRQRHAQAVREQAAAEHDPLTGFLNAKNFHAFASKAWARARRLGRFATVIYVQVEPKEEGDPTTLEQEAHMLRSVRMVRTAMREFDVVGRLGRNLIGICVTDRPSNDALAARLSRLVALGWMPEDPRQALRLTLAVGEHECFFDGYPLLEDALLNLLKTPPDSNRKPIRYIGRVAAHSSLSLQKI